MKNTETLELAKTVQGCCLVWIDYYGSQTPLSQIANIKTFLNAKTIVVQPWEKQMIPEIEKELCWLIMVQPNEQWRVYYH